MKKILGILISFLALITLCSFDTKIVEVGTITNQTDIYTDLITLGLTPSDYITTENIDNGSYVDDYYYYDEVYLIAIGENRQQEEYTDVYLYFYNPYIDGPAQNYYFQMKINNYIFSFGYMDSNNTWSDYPSYSEPDFELEKCSYDSSRNITKVKFQYAYLVAERTYSLDGITRVSDNKSFDNPFSCTYSIRQEDGHLIADFEYNSFIYITQDEVVQLRFTDLKSISEYSPLYGFLNGVLGSDDLGNAIYFYNFSSSKKIEQILEADISYVKHMIQGYYNRPNPFSDELNFSGVDKLEPISTTIYKDDKSTIIAYEKEVEFDAFQTPSSNRLNEFTSEMNITDEVKELFTSYEHSICFMVATNNDSRNYSGEGFVNLTYVEDFQLSRLKFETNGVLYNSYVIDDSDDGGEFVPIDPKPKWWEELLNWIKDHPFETLLIAVGCLIGIPLLVIVLPFLAKAIMFIVEMLFKGLVWIITAPFKLIKWIFTGGKKNE